MSSDQQTVTSKEMHKEAQEYVKRLTAEFSDKLLLQSKILAADDEMVLKSHVSRAYRIVTNKMKETWLPELLRLTGGGFFGGSVMAFINESSLQSLRVFWLTVYFSLTK